MKPAFVGAFLLASVFFLGTQPSPAVTFYDSRANGNEDNGVYFAAKDKTHLTEAGYAIKAEVVARVIEKAVPFKP